MAEEVIVTRGNGVLTLTLDRAEKKNALTAAMYATLAEALTTAGAEAEIGAILILGQPGIFTAGNDIKDFLQAATSGLPGGPVSAFLMALANNEKPLLAGVDGAAVGIGTTLMLHCDYVLATPQAVFATPFVDLGLLPEAGSSLLGPALMGDRLAFELLVMGEKFDASRAAQVGLVNRIVAADSLAAEARAAAERIAAKPREALAISRRLLRGDRAALRARIEEEAALFGERLRSAEAITAFQAFLARSK